MELLSLVQEGNTALVETLEAFTGSAAEKFKEQVIRRVEDRFARLLGSRP
jgi:hypothetical protein